MTNSGDTRSRNHVGNDATMVETKLNCSSCGYRWTYEGPTTYATCPNCGRSTRVKR